jgi:hypothetical protein
LPRLAIATNGTFVAVRDGSDGEGEGVFARRFTAQGGAPGSEGRVNSTKAEDQSEADVAMDLAGNFVVTWSGNGAADRDGVFVQRYGSTGVRQGGEILTKLWLDLASRSSEWSSPADLGGGPGLWVECASQHPQTGKRGHSAFNWHE